MRSKKAMLEAALFMANEPLSVERLMKIMHTDAITLDSLLKELEESLANPERGIHLIKSEQGYHLMVKPDYVQNVRGLTPYRDLSRGLLRVLALVAYKQPLTQSEIVKVIGNRAYEYVKILSEKGLIRTVKSGRTKALVATNEFANYFGAQNMDEVKKMLGDPNAGDVKS